jgi:phosphohistidine phosphatase
MDLLFMRHAEAERRDLYPDDHQRPLTAKGQHEQRLVVRALLPLLQPLDYLLSSPLLRARQTADIVAEALRFAGQVEQTPVLGGACAVGSVLDLLQGYPRQARILCVGHEPDMSRLCAIFLDGEGRSAMAFQAGAVLGLTFTGHPMPGRGILRFFLRPTDVLALLPQRQE